MNTTNGADEHRCIYRLMPRLHVYSPPAQSSRVRATSNHARRGISHSSYFPKSHIKCGVTAFGSCLHCRVDTLSNSSIPTCRVAIHSALSLKKGAKIVKAEKDACVSTQRHLCSHPKTPVFPPINTPVFLLKDACVFLQTQLSFSKLQQRHDLLFRIMPPTYCYSVLKPR